MMTVVNTAVCSVGKQLREQIFGVLIAGINVFSSFSFYCIYIRWWILIN